jgi:hypothetical protein
LGRKKERENEIELIFIVRGLLEIVWDFQHVKLDDILEQLSSFAMNPGES